MATQLGGNIIDHYHEGYTQQLLSVFQQKQSRLRNFVDTISGSGNVLYFDKKGANTSREITQRRATRAPQDATYERRAVTHHLIHAEEAFDDPMDVERQLNSPQDRIIADMHAEMNRQMDAFIIRALSGDQTVQTNDVSAVVPFDSNQVIAVNNNALAALNPAGLAPTGNTSLHEGKIESALAMLAESEVFEDGDEVFVVANARQMKFLKSRPASTNTAYMMNRSPDPQHVGYGSALDGLAGVTRFITYNNIPQVSGNDAVYVFVRKAVRLWMIQEPVVKVFPQHNIVTSPPALEAYMRIGTARAYEDGVVRILCHPTAGFPTA